MTRHTVPSETRSASARKASIRVCAISVRMAVVHVEIAFVDVCTHTTVSFEKISVQNFRHLIYQPERIQCFPTKHCSLRNETVALRCNKRHFNIYHVVHYFCVTRDGIIHMANNVANKISFRTYRCHMICYRRVRRQDFSRVGWNEVEITWQNIKLVLNLSFSSFCPLLAHLEYAVVAERKLVRTFNILFVGNLSGISILRRCGLCGEEEHSLVQIIHKSNKRQRRQRIRSSNKKYFYK